MRTFKLALGWVFATLAFTWLSFCVMQAWRGATENPVGTIVLGIGTSIVPGLIALMLYLECRADTSTDSRDLLAWLRRPIGSSAAFDHARTPESALAGDVVVEFTTYAGFLFFVTWREWKFALPPDEARKALRAMFWSTIFCGALALGGFFVVPMAIAAYWQQLRSIRRQEEAALLQASRHFKPSANRFS